MTLVDHSPDLTRLVEDGFDVEIRDANLLIHHVPYLTSNGAVDYCIVVSELTTDGERTVQPGRHEVWIVGEVPHDHQGKKLPIVIEEGAIDFGPGLVASSRLSGKLHNQHPANYYDKIANYVQVLGKFARFVDPDATHTDYPARETSANESVFLYHDAASSRSGLSAVTKKLEGGRIGIVGLGGTGSYILDLVAKTPVAEIHLFDDDEFLAHNAFRAPGAALLADVKQRPRKVEFFASVYAKFRRNIVAHPMRITPDNLTELKDLTFVFLAMDAGPAKQAIIDFLHEGGTPFVDCGMGLKRIDNALRGTVRTTSSDHENYDHIARRISFHDITQDEYDLNLQTADLNMLNAVMAVIRWKKMMGYYSDSAHEYNSVYSVASNLIVNGEVGK
jgi:predicted ThiF/HesA family dinucleotide-utilizing enzyme